MEGDFVTLAPRGAQARGARGEARIRQADLHQVTGHVVVRRRRELREDRNVERLPVEHEGCDEESRLRGGPGAGGRVRRERRRDTADDCCVGVGDSADRPRAWRRESVPRLQQRPSQRPCRPSSPVSKAKLEMYSNGTKNDRFATASSPAGCKYLISVPPAASVLTVNVGVTAVAAGPREREPH